MPRSAERTSCLGIRDNDVTPAPRTAPTTRRLRMPGVPFLYHQLAIYELKRGYASGKAIRD